jgi:hypothetical protein
MMTVDGSVTINHDPEAGAVFASAEGDFAGGYDLYDGKAADFMAAIGFLPDPGCAGTWYETGAFCVVPDWIEFVEGFGMKIKRGDPEFYEEMRHLFMTGKPRT